ncbi:hypothetical protein JCM10295v2_002044 [Rhodotorula toruloides]
MNIDSGVSLEHAHRAYVASLASQLVQDALTSADYLLALALPSHSQPLTPLAIGHDERNIEFWDDRKLHEWEKGAREIERWEMSKGQVEEIKRVRKELSDAVKEIREVDKTSLAAGIWLFPQRLSDDLVLARSDRSNWEKGMASFEPTKVVPNLLQYLAEAHPPDFDNDLLALEQVPGPVELHDLKLVATPAQLTHVKETRLDFVQKTKEAKDLGLFTGADGSLEAVPLDLPMSPRIGSPPIFPRPKSSFVDAAANSFQAFLPSEGSAYPSSPRGSDFLRAEWDREDALTLPPSSPRTSTRSEKVSGPQQVWSSSQVGDLPPDNDLSIELPAFGREMQIKSARVEAESWWEDVSAFVEDEDEVDQLDSDYEDDAPNISTCVGADAHGKRKWDLLSSDQMIGVRGADDEGDLIAQARLPGASGTHFAQSLLPGLRSLTIDLSWQAWRLPPGETLEDVACDGGADIPFPPPTLSPVHAVAGYVNDDELPSDALTVSGTCHQSSSTETLSPRVEVFGLDSSYLHRHQPVDATARIEVRGEQQLFANAGDAQHDEAMTGVAALLEMASSGSPGFASPLGRNRQPPDREPFIEPNDDSSDFGFIFPSSSLNGDEMASLELQSVKMGEDQQALTNKKRSPMPTLVDEPVAAASVAPSAAVETDAAALTPFASTWSMTNALDNFLAARGAKVSTEITQSQPLKQRGVPAPTETAFALQQRSSPPPGIIPFAAPPFIAHSSHFRSTRDAIRVVGFDSIFQMRSHFLALQQNGILPVHRPSRFAASSFEILEPHLIVHPTTAVLYVKLASVIGNAVPSESAVSTSARTEPIFTTIARLSERFDRLAVILEEQQTRVGLVKSYSFTPPVLEALKQLTIALSGYRDGQHGIKLVLSKGASHSAELTRRFVDWLRSEDAGREDLPVLDRWEERSWLQDDPTEGEATLLQQFDLNELSASAILAIASLNDFLGMSPNDRRAIFGSAVGVDRIDRISHALDGQSRPASVDSFQSIELDVEPAVSLSIIAASGHDGLSDNEDDFNFSEFVDLSQ